MLHQPHKEMHILIVEDDDFDFEIVKQQLQSTRLETYHLTRTKDVEGALKAVEAETFDIALVDQNLGQRKGIDFLKSIGEDSAPFPIIIMTGADDDTIDLAALEAGATDYLRKSVTTPELLIKSIRYSIRHFSNLKALEVAKQEAEAAVDAKSQFLATMSHEIRTPMNGIVGILDLLMRGQQTKEQREQAKMAQDSALHLMTIINDILDLSKLDAGKTDPSYQPMNVAETLQDILSLFRIEAQKKGLDLRLTLDKQVPEWISADASRLRQVLVNLINNAIKFTAHGSVALNVSLNEDVDGYQLQFEVHDTGIGVPEGSTQQLFDRFVQLDPTLSRTHGGVGLGLAICKEYVALMGGEIGVDRKPEGGSTFWFTLRAEDGKNPTARTEKAEPRKPAAGSPLDILVVEDNETNQHVIEAFLEISGDNISVVENGAEALAAVKKRSYDIILMDIQMPIMDGIEATNKIREMDIDTPIIALTANAMVGDKEHYLASGMSAYISKPIDPETLWATLKETHEAHKKMQTKLDT